MFHDGFWAPEVGFYGGIDYGYGYFGHGFEGGRWQGDRFFYNRAVVNVNTVNIRNVYNQNVNVRVNVGERLPDSVRPRPLPRDIVEIVPQFRDYDYTVIEDRVAVIDPRTREVVDILDEGGYGDRRDRAAGGYEYGREHFTFTPEQRGLLRREATGTVGSTGGNSACMTLQPVPAELARSHPELAVHYTLAQLVS